MTTAKDVNLHQAEDFARKLFFENPSLSIDEAARVINENCPRGLIKNTISEIRRSVRHQIHAGATKTAHIEAPKSQPKQVEPFNPPRLSAVPKEVEPIKADKNLRSAFLNSWAEQNPHATINQAREALYKRFGMAMGTSYIADTLRLARECYENAQKEKGVEPAIPTIHSPVEPIAPKEQDPRSQQETPVIQANGLDLQKIARSLSEAGVRSITIKEDGTLEVCYRLG